MESCGEAAGLYAVTRAMAVEHGFLDYWRSRVRWSLPWLTSHSTFQTVCWQSLATPGLERCQKWFHFAATVRDLPTAVRNAELAEYERELYPELCT